MKLRRPCEAHGKYDAHLLESGINWCPGGVFLPDDTLVIEKVDGEWPQWIIEQVDDAAHRLVAERHHGDDLRRFLDDLVALSVREAPEVDKNQMGMW